MENDAVKQPVKLKIKEDGVYLQINKSGGQKVSRADIMQIVEFNKVKDIDFTAINDLFKNEQLEFEALISYNTDVFIKREDVKLNVSQDKLMATIIFTAPINSDEYLTFDQLKAFLTGAGVIYGVNEEELLTIYSKREYGRPYVVARGLPPVDGIDGRLVFYFNTQKKTFRPKYLDDGSVDFKQLDLIDVINADEKLIEGIPPIAGSDGMNILGKPISHKPGKPYPSILKTKNTKFSEDGRTLYAACSGQLVYKNNKVEVFPVLQVSKDVDNAVGNIDFVGSVVIAGNVLTGFTVKAQGNIEVNGVLEGGELIAGENIILVNGAQGVEKASITAKGNIQAKYIDQCNVSAGNNIYSDFITHSRVKCGGKIELTGKRGLLLGGKTTVKEKIVANTIGANLSGSTEIELGFIPDEYEKYKEINKELSEYMNEYDNLKNKSDNLEIEALRGISPSEVKILKASNLYSISHFEEKIAELQNQLEELTPDCSNEDTCIIVNKNIHSGVKVTIGNAQTIVFENEKNCKIRNENGKVVFTNI